MPDLNNTNQMRDAAGNVLAVGDEVVYKMYNSLVIGTIKHFSPKMIRVINSKNKSKREVSIYPVDVVKPEGKNMEPITNESYSRYCARVIKQSLAAAKSDMMPKHVFNYNLFRLTNVLGRGLEAIENEAFNAIKEMKRSLPTHQKRWEQEDLMDRIRGNKRGHN